MIQKQIWYLLFFAIVLLQQGCSNKENKENKETPEDPVQKLLNGLPPIPKGFFEKSVAWPTDLATLEALYGPGENLVRSDKEFSRYVWKNRAINGCNSVNIELVFDNPTEASADALPGKKALRLRMENCPLELLDLIGLLGNSAEPETESQRMYWLYREGFVEVDDSLMMVVISNYKPNQIKKMEKKERLEAHLEAMKRPIKEINFDVDDPQKENNVRPFINAIASPSVKMLPALVYPFAVDGKNVETITNGIEIIKKFVYDTQAKDELGKIDVCEGTTYEKLLAGEPFREDLGSLERTEDRLKKHFKRLPGLFEHGDMLINCYVKGQKWVGIFLTYRKVGAVWRPSGYLD